MPRQTVAEAELLTSELVSNAVRHAGADGNGAIRLKIAVGPQTVHVSVVDGGAGFDSTDVARSPRSDEAGWGLFIVEEISDQWGRLRIRIAFGSRSTTGDSFGGARADPGA